MSPRQPRARPTTFHFPNPNDPLLGHAQGMQASQLRRLRAGQIRPEFSIDLHGLRADEARRQVHAELSDAVAEGVRCVMVIHGKGLRSADGPVLRQGLAEWLADPQLHHCVLAFAPAQQEDGGRGASYVLLRRRGP